MPALRQAAKIPLISALVVVPCFWQQAIQAGDLSSHVYNAWLYLQIRETGLPGLRIVTKYTNVLFDAMLAYLASVAGLQWAERIAVSVVVVAFFWGAFLFVRTIAQRPPWELTPVFLILTYGTIFQAGFLNFLLGCGLGGFGAALLVGGGRRTRWIAALIFALAIAAHAMAAACMFGCALYALIPVNRRKPALIAVLALAAACHVALTRLIHNYFEWGSAKLLIPLALDQFGVYAPRYFIVGLGVSAICLSAAVGKSAPSQARTLCAHLLVIAVAAAILAPEFLNEVPGYSNGISYVDLRLSLFVALAWCGVAASAEPSRPRAIAACACAALFFSFFWLDQSAANRLEARIRASVLELPKGSRVAAVLRRPTLRVNVIQHMLARVCAGHCFAYLNYEPSTTHFRVVATGANRYVLASSREVALAELVGYKVKPGDVPIYEVRISPDLTRIETRTLQPGDTVAVQTVPVFSGN